MADVSYTLTILSNNGGSTLYNGTVNSSQLYVTSTGVTSLDTEIYTYSGSSVFLGLSTSANATSPTTAVGESYALSGNTTLYIVEQTPVNYRPLTYTDAKIQVDSAIRDANGVRIDTNYQKKPQVIEYTVPTTVTSGSRVIAEYDGTYDGSPGYVKFAIEVTSSSNKGIYVIEATWGQTTGNITLLSGNGVTSDVSNMYLFYPSSASYYSSAPPLLVVGNSSSREKQVKITVLESSGDLTWKTDWGTTPSTTGRSTYSASLGYYSQVYRATSASSASSSTSSGYTQQTRNKTFRVGESDSYRLMAVDHTGVAYKINTSTKKFPLPISMYCGMGSSAGSTSYSYQITSTNDSSGYTNVSNLTSSTYNNFTMPTLTASDGGKTLYVRGSLDADGYFVCDGNVTLSMEAGYTYIPFGTLTPNYSGSTAQVPTKYSLNVISVPAYTIDANGKLTHIDGKPISNGITVSSSAPTGGSDGDIWIQY